MDPLSDLHLAGITEPDSRKVAIFDLQYGDILTGLFGDLDTRQNILHQGSGSTGQGIDRRAVLLDLAGYAFLLDKTTISSFFKITLKSLYFSYSFPTNCRLSASENVFFSWASI